MHKVGETERKEAVRSAHSPCERKTEACEKQDMSHWEHYRPLCVCIKAVFSLRQSSSSFSDSEFTPPAVSSSPHTVGIPRYNTLLLVKSRPSPKPKPNPTRTPLPLESVTCSLVLLQKGALAAPECSCRSTKTAANVARMKAQLSTATSTGKRVDVSTLGISESASSTRSLWSTGLMGDLRCTWF